jgi:predicted Zn-dependent peptidase
VRDQKIAAAAQAAPSLPGDKYPGLFVLLAVPTPGHTPTEVQASLRAEVERLKKEDVADDELRMIKTRAKANLIRRLGDNQGLAVQLGSYHNRYGDWRELFREVERIDKVTKEDIRRVAGATFVEANRTVGVLESTRPASAPKGGQ